MTASGLRSGDGRAGIRAGRAAAFSALAAFAVLVLFGASAVRAQEARVEVGPGPYYQGQPIEVDVVAQQFEEEPAPAVDFEPQPGLTLRFLGVSPSTSTSITIVNGKIDRVHEVSFIYRYELSSARVGTLRVPAFRVRQGATVRQTEPFDLEIGAVPKSDDFGIAVALPKGPIFVGQKVPIVVEFRIDQAILKDSLSYRVQIPLFDVPGLRFIDGRTVGANSELEIVTSAGAMRLPAVSEERIVGGRSCVVLRAERTLVAQKPGRIEAAAPTVSIERGTRFRRGVFGQREVVATERAVAAGRPVDLEVAEVPSQGRPASFAGAVGSDFHFEVKADRSVVQLGEPIELALDVRGHGDLSSAGLPPLDAQGLFDPRRFRLPDEPPAGLLDADGKHFKVTVRVLDAGVREIPALAYSWFDADTRRFETVRSEPIALSVGAAQVVGAQAVTSRAGSTAEDEALAQAGASSRAAGAEAVDAAGVDGMGAPGSPTSAADARLGSLAESAANLAVERDPARLLGAARVQRGTGIAAVSLYALGLALLAVAFVDRRRRAVDPALRDRIEQLARARRAIEAALAPDQADGPGALGRALRELVAARPDEASPEVDALLADCDALRFAPGVGAGTRAGSGAESSSAGARRAVPSALAERARRWVEARQTEAVAGARGRAPVAGKTSARRDARGQR